MPNYNVTVSPGPHAASCSCAQGAQTYNITADSQMLAIAAAGEQWFNTRCPNAPPSGCIHNRGQLINECGYNVQQVEEEAE